MIIWLILVYTMILGTCCCCGK